MKVKPTLALAIGIATRMAAKARIAFNLSGGTQVGRGRVMLRVFAMVSQTSVGEIDKKQET